MTVCSTCGTENPDHVYFCGKCAAELPRPMETSDGGIRCPQCGDRNPTDQRYCGSCGAELDNEMGPVEVKGPPVAPEDSLPETWWFGLNVEMSLGALAFGGFVAGVVFTSIALTHGSYALFGFGVLFFTLAALGAAMMRRAAS